jgi:hypothetical protein
MSLIKRCLTGAIPLIFLSTMFGCDDGAGGLRVQVTYHEPSGHLRASVTRDLATGETLHLRVRNGLPTELDCAAQYGSIDQIQGNEVSDPFPHGPTYEGPVVDEAMFDTPYNTPDWLTMEPTAEMLAAIADGGYVIDVCLMNGPTVVLQDSMDILQALDQLGDNGKYDGETEERIASTVAYAEACVAEMGDIPFFPKLADGDYGTYNCLDSTPIPTTVTNDTGVEFPEAQVGICDNPQYIYSLCEANAVSGRTNGPRVTSASNDQGTHWVLLCRKAKAEEGQYNDVAMIGYNPYTGRTCFFQNALYNLTDGAHVPHPGDKVESTASPQESASLWEGIHGGLGSGIECADCHSYDAFIHSPWIDGALNENGDPVVPKMGVDEDFALGFNDMPYSIVNLQGQGWTHPDQLVSQEAAACTQCHRAGYDRWAKEWMTRMESTDSAWTAITTPAYQQFEHAFWMPPDLEGIEPTGWANSEYGRAMDFIQMCGADRSNPACQWAPVPATQVFEPGEPVTVDLEGQALAIEAAKIFGADVRDASDPRCTGPEGSCATRRCAECHSTSRNGLRHWLELTQHAWDTCDLTRDPASMTQEEAMRTVDCMRVDPADRNSVFAAEKIGIHTTGVQYSHFRDLFRQAFGDTWLVEYLKFRQRVSMPKGNHPRFTEIEYATVLKWYQNNLNDLDTVIQDPPPPSTCTDEVTPALDTHINDMQVEGWTAVNADNGIRMFGCTTANPRECLSSTPDRTSTWGAGGVGTLRELTRLSFRSSFWTRSSADGRFVGNGGGARGGATMTDLQRSLDIGVQASYDPGFFPDNSGWIFQGGGAGICTQALLETDTFIDFSEPECIKARGINLYQHVARGLDGGDYFIINSQFTSDPGSGNEDPRANFAANSTMKFTPMVFGGSTYSQLPEVIVDSPYEGDSVLSPSGRVVISRLAGPEGSSLGYVLRRVNATRTGDNYRIDISQRLGTVCMPGAKPNISYDERFFVTHHYEGGTSNIYIVDLRSGNSRRVTNMPADARALFPHFRSDGWFYFLVKQNDGAEFVVASDAALAIAAGG